MLLSVLINISARVFYLGVGGMGVITVIPNIMSGASGTPEANHAAHLGLAASGLFILSGLSGVIHNPFIPLWIAHGLGLAGCLAQARAFNLMNNVRRQLNPYSNRNQDTRLNPRLGQPTLVQELVIPFIHSLTIESLQTIIWAYSQFWQMGYFNFRQITGY
jgi:hypothetical protein